MGDLISKASVCEILADIYPTDGEKVVEVKQIDKAYNKILELPSLQSEIIRCVDCIHNGSFDTDCPISWNGKEFCNFAERWNDSR